jgi:SAM-dependent methyltransferase
MMTSDPVLLLATLRRAEGEAALAAARALAALAADRRYLYLGRAGLAETLRAELPSLDRGSARALEAIGRLALAGVASDAELAPLGLTRLALIADASDALRDSFIAAGALPLGEMRRALRAAREAKQTAVLRGETTEKTSKAAKRTPAEAATAAAEARAALDAIRDGYTDAVNRILDAARVIAALPDDTGLATRLETELGIDAAERERAVRLIAAAEPLPPARRLAIGIGALRALAQLDDERREPLTVRLRRETGGADAALTLIRAGATASDETVASGAIPVIEPTLLSLVFLGESAPKGEPKFAEATPVELAELLVAATPAGGRVLDLTAGTGTVARVAARLGRTARSLDILDPSLDPSVEVGDARSVDPGDVRYDLVIAHPPLPGEIRYSERYAGRALPGDLSLLDPAGFTAALTVLAATAARCAAPDGRVALLLRESRVDGRFYDWPALAVGAAAQAGLELIDKWLIPLRPAERADLLRRAGFAARREGRSLPAASTLLLFTARR